MKKAQIHIYLSDELLNLLKWRPEGMGLTPSQYTRYLIVKDVDAHPKFLAMRKPSEKSRLKEEFDEE